MVGMRAFVVAVAVAVAVSGCTAANRTALAISTATLACDWAQTRALASEGWPGYHESNPIMGPKPSTGDVTLYFSSAIAINAAVYHLMPRRWKALLPGAVTASQIKTIAVNTPHTGLCGM